MPRGKKALVDDVLDDEDENESNDTVKPINIPKLELDVSKLVSSVRGRYGKDKGGLSQDIVAGDGINLPTNDEAYVLSNEVEFWKPLIGVKGVPYGRMVQVSGKPDSGKSTTAMLFMTAAQKAGALVILWDSEKKFDVARYKGMMGGDPDQVVVSRSKNIIDGAKQVAWYVREAKEQNPDIKIFIVWDSVGATLNSKQDDDDEDEYSQQPGVDAKEITFAVKKFNKLMERYRDRTTGEETIAVLCINQVYANIGSHGSKEKGGGGIEYLSSVILQLTRKSDLTRTRDGHKIKYGIITRAKVKKNHLFSGEDCIAELDLVVTSDGITLESKIRDSFVKSGIIIEKES
jgi:RecA/RadA recombinase